MVEKAERFRIDVTDLVSLFKAKNAAVRKGDMQEQNRLNGLITAVETKIKKECSEHGIDINRPCRPPLNYDWVNDSNKTYLVYYNFRNAE